MQITTQKSMENWNTTLFLISQRYKIVCKSQRFVKAFNFFSTVSDKSKI